MNRTTILFVPSTVCVAPYQPVDVKLCAIQRYSNMGEEQRPGYRSSCVPLHFVSPAIFNYLPVHAEKCSYCKDGGPFHQVCQSRGFVLLVYDAGHNVGIPGQVWLVSSCIGFRFVCNLFVDRCVTLYTDIYSFIHSFIHSFTHSLIHSFIHLF